MRQSSSPPNLNVLRPSRKRVVAGDVFVMQPPDGRYLYGRVISTQASWGASVAANLIYVFKTRSDTKTVPHRAGLGTDRLLIEPAVINRLPWSRGYFETVANLPFAAGEVLEQHCFEDSGGRYFDEAGRQLPQRIEPCGFRGLHSFRTIDDLVSKALGIPLAPD